MLAIDESASSFCAREMRGTLSIASTVALRAASDCIRSGFCAGQMKLTSMPPSRSSATSSVVGPRTLKTMSDVAHSCARVGDDLSTRRPVRVVADLRGIACARLDGDAKTQLDQLLDDLGHRGDALLAREDFPRHSDQQ